MKASVIRRMEKDHTMTYLGHSIFFMREWSKTVWHCCDRGRKVNTGGFPIHWGEMKQREDQGRTVYWCDHCGHIQKDGIAMVLNLAQANL